MHTPPGARPMSARGPAGVQELILNWFLSGNTAAPATVQRRGGRRSCLTQ